MTNINELRQQLIAALEDEIAQDSDAIVAMSDRIDTLTSQRDALVEVRRQRNDEVMALRSHLPAPEPNEPEPDPTEPPTEVVFQCPDCDAEFETDNGRKIHWGRVHGAAAADRAAAVVADELVPAPEPAAPPARDEQDPTPEFTDDNLKIHGYWCNDCDPPVGWARLSTLGTHVRVAHDADGPSKEERRRRRGVDI